MDVFKLLFQSEYGLFSLGVILFMMVMAIYMFGRFRKLMNDKPGKEGWQEPSRTASRQPPTREQPLAVLTVHAGQSSATFRAGPHRQQPTAD